MTSPFLGIKFYAKSWGDILPDVNVLPEQSISENHDRYCDKSLLLNFVMCQLSKQPLMKYLKKTAMLDVTRDIV